MYSIKRYIVSYISHKILKSEFPINHKLPSENTLARKFNCSRLTARGSLVALQYAGVLKVIRGSGYYVSENAIIIILLPKFIMNQSKSYKTKILSTNEEFVQLLTEYYDENNKVIGIVKWIFSKEMYMDISQQYELEMNVCDYIINSSIKGFFFNEHIEYNNEFEKMFVIREYFDENKNLVFRVHSWYVDFKQISSKKFEIN